MLNRNAMSLQYRFLTLLAVICFYTTAHAQLVVTPANTAAENEAAVLTLVGEGITIENVDVQCGTDAFGTYTFDGPILGFNAGIVLASGGISGAVGPNDQTGVTINVPNPPLSNDSDLAAIAGVAIQDICVAEFDLTPAGDEITFLFVWASDEYPEFVCSTFNDVFGFFIDGPNPAGGDYNGLNLAVVPSSTTPVTINTINNGNNGTGSSCTTPSGSNCPCNPTYYFNNPDFDSPIQYDGFTKVLTAYAETVPCETYHLKLAVADGTDTILDSAVFLGAESLNSPSVQVEHYSDHSINGELVGLEGCVNAFMDINFTFNTTVDVEMYFEMSGSATPGVDYTMMLGGVDITGQTGGIIFEPGQTLQTIEYVLLADSDIEGTEDIIFTVTGLDFCSSLEGISDQVTIYENINAEVLIPNLDACPGATIPLQASNGAEYHWYPEDLVADPLSSTTFGYPTETMAFECVVTIGSCTESVFVQVDFGEDPPYSDTSYAICDDNVNGIPMDEYAGATEASFSWSPTDFLSDPNIPNPVFTGNSPQTYTVTMQPLSAQYCEATVMVDVQILSNEGFDAGEDISNCITVSDVIGPVSIPGYTYSWSPTDGLSDPNIAQPTATVNLNGGAENTVTYTLTVEDPDGCVATGEVNATALAELNLVAPEDVYVFVGEPTNITVAGAGSGGTYSWAPDQWLSSTSGSSVTVTAPNNQQETVVYTVNGENTSGCTGTININVHIATRAIAAVPSAFSPNSDGFNDILYIYSQDVSEILEWRIFNRWGELVYQNNGDIAQGWDGTHQGREQDLGVYTYFLRYKGLAASDISESRGNVSLLR